MDETEALIHDTWGEETGSPMLVALRFFDAYFELYCALNEPWHGDEADQGVREARALRVFKAAVKCGKYMEAGGPTISHGRRTLACGSSFGMWLATVTSGVSPPVLWSSAAPNLSG